MKKFLQTKLKYFSVLLIAFFCLVTPYVLQAQPTQDLTSLGGHIFATPNSRLVASIEEVDSVVIVDVFMIGTSLAEQVEFGFYYNANKLKLVDPTLKNAIPFQTLPQNCNANPLIYTALEPSPKINLSCNGTTEWKYGVCFHKKEGVGSGWFPDYKNSLIENMHLFHGAIFNAPHDPTVYSNVVNPGQGQIFPIFKCYLINTKYETESLANTDLGFGNSNTGMANSSCAWNYDGSYVEYILRDPGISGAGYTSDVYSNCFNFRSPSHVKALTPTNIADHTATLNGEFARSISDLTEANDMLSGHVYTDYAANIIENTHDGILRYDKVLNYGYIYTSAKNVDIKVDKFSHELIINNTSYPFNPTLGDHTFVVGDKTFNYVWKNNTSSDKIIDGANAAMDISGLASGTNYYVWAVLEANFETSNNFFLVDPITFKTTGAIDCNPLVAVSSIFTVAEPSCSPNNNGSIQFYVSGGSGLYSYKINGAGNPINYTNGLIENLSPGVYWVEVYDNEKLECAPAISSAITLHSEGDLNVGITHIVDAPSCNSDGAVQISVTGAKGTLSYFLDNNDVTSSVVNGVLSPVSLGTHVIQVVDGLTGCTATSSEIRVNARDSELAIVFGNKQDATCTTATGSMEFTVTGATTFTYQLDELPYGDGLGNTLITLSNLSAGSHQLRVWDNCGETEREFIITNGTGAHPFSVVAAVTPEVVDCHNDVVPGFIELTVTGDPNNIYEYSYNEGKNWHAITFPKDTIHNLTNGVYTIEVRSRMSADTCTYTLYNVELDRIVPETLNIGTIYAATNPTCAGTPGEIQVVATGGSGNYEYSKDGANYTPYTNGLITGLTAGTYTIYVKDVQQQGCPPARSQDITLYNTNSDLSVSVKAIDATGCKVDDGALYATATGGVGTTYTYTLLPAGTTNNTGTFTGLTPGNYTVTVTNNGCLVSSGEVRINSSATNDQITLSIAGATTSTSCGIAQGSANITVSPNGAYKYQLNGEPVQTFNGTTIALTGLNAGTHQLHVWSDCAESTIEVIIANDGGNNALAFSAETTPELLDCNGKLSAGFITLKVNGGTAPYQYRVDNGVWKSFSGTTVTFNASVGTYKIEVKDKAACSYTDNNVEIKRIVPETLNIGTIYVVANPACGGNGGEIQVVATGGSGNYLYSKDGLTYASYTNGLITGLTAGTYTIYVRDVQQQGCPSARSQDITLYNTSSDLSVSVKAIDATGCTSNDGALYATATGGVGTTYTYTLVETGATNSTGAFTGLIPGNYTVTVTNGICLVSSGEVRINSSDTDDQITLSIAGTTTPTPCGIAQGSANITVISKSACKYQLNGEPVQTLNGTNIALAGLGAGKHQLHVWSDCAESTIEVVIANEGDNNALAFSAETTPELLDCNGKYSAGFITLNVNGGTAPYQYRIDNGVWKPISGTPITFPASVGTYKIEVKDSKACSYTNNNVEIKRIVPETLNIGTIYAATNPACGGNGGAIQVVATGGSGNYEYSKDGANYAPYTNGLITGLTAGTYTIYVRDVQQKYCPSARSQDITLYNTDSQLGVSVEVLNASGCTSNDGALYATATGGTGTTYTYTLVGTSATNSTGTFTGLTPGNYTVTVTNNGCLASSGEVRINSSATTDQITLSIAGATTPTPCGTTHGSANITVSPNGTYNYQLNGEPVQTLNGTNIALAGLGAGKHQLHVWSDCAESTIEVVIANEGDNNALAFSAETTPELLDCNGKLSAGFITLKVNGGTAPYQYRIDNGVWKPISGTTITFIASVGIYKIEVKDSKACSYTDNNVEIKRIVPKDLNIGTIYAAVNPTCGGNGGAIQVVATGGSGKYLYSTDGSTYTSYTNGIITGLTAGTYTIYVKDVQQQSCPPAQSDAIVLANAVTDLTITVTPEDAAHCNALGALHISVSGGTGNLKYFIGNTEVTNDIVNGTLSRPTGVYVINVTDGNCMASSGKVRISTTDPNELISIASIVTTQADCGVAIGKATVTVNNHLTEYKYKLNGGLVVTTSSSTLEFSGLNAGTHVLHVWNDCGEVIDTIKIANETANNGLAFTFKAFDETIDCNGNPVAGQIELAIKNGTPNYQYRVDGGVWKPVSNVNFTITNLAVGIYKVEVKDAKGCTFTANDITIKHHVPEILQVGSLFAAVNPTCGGTGSIQVYATGGSGDYLYSYNGGTYLPYTNGLITGVPAGTYTISVKDAQHPSCPPAISQSITLYSQQTNLAVHVTVDSIETCGATNGSLTVAVSGGAAPYTYFLNGTELFEGSTINNGVIANKPADVYVVDVKDKDGCLASSGEVRITTKDPETAISLEIVSTQEATCGSSTGAATFEVTTAEALPYYYQLNEEPVVTINHKNQITLSALSAGTHFIKVWNNCGEAIDTIKITNGINSFAASVTVVDEVITCSSMMAPGSITITVENGVPGYQYRYEDKWVDFQNAQVTINDLKAGNYVIEVRDHHNCTFVVNDVKVDRVIDDGGITPPTATTPQTFCKNATIADLQAIGVNIKWYNEVGQLMAPGAQLTNGAIYLATQTVGSCESATRTAVKVILEDQVITAPSITSPQHFCAPATFADIAINGNTNIVWYDAAYPNGDKYELTDELVSGIYYAALSAGGDCESITRTEVEVIVDNVAPTAPVIVSPQSFCKGALLANIEVPNNQIVWYNAPTGGTVYPAATYLVDGQIYYAAQKAGSCESTTRTPVTVSLGTTQKPTAQPLQAFCDGLAGKTIADIAITGGGIIWYNEANQVLPLSTPLVEGAKYFATQSTGTCESEKISVQVTENCYKLYGTVFPFAHSADPILNDLFPTYAKLYPYPPANANLSNYFSNTLPLYSVRLAYYDDQTYIPGTPKNPGQMAQSNNPGLPILWSQLGYTIGTVDNTTVTGLGDQPSQPLGVFTFPGVAKGTYILEISRPGFISRRTPITVTQDAYLGHREILAGDVDGTLIVDQRDATYTNSRCPASYFVPDSNYDPKYDFNASGTIDKEVDLKQILFFNFGASSTIYKETYEWIFGN